MTFERIPLEDFVATFANTTGMPRYLYTASSIVHVLVVQSSLAWLWEAVSRQYPMSSLQKRFISCLSKLAVPFCCAIHALSLIASQRRSACA